MLAVYHAKFLIFAPIIRVDKLTMSTISWKCTQTLAMAKFL